MIRLTETIGRDRFITQETKIKNRKDIKLNVFIFVSYCPRQNEINLTTLKKKQMLNIKLFSNCKIQLL